ncbi:hypothetical protein RIR_e46191_A0A2N1M8K3_9GLOM [Rhizophagus irregularis DAOM 181602=DAOM 197198]|uniref:Uncharacterized protein n=1 Tax=Rhizophagus irregularis TaxID=588596 RepID=A0A2N1M8K3_9GLOM|nr:hypothetical protein RhiirC2_797120 [Rhizophagus irregularis]GET61345.1 hypothetical protein RIR_e46191_A0A2N1M8K3_9GLOM [Rhizophagus irregularis DAOM 181602=DAOM 197198]
MENSYQYFALKSLLNLQLMKIEFQREVTFHNNFYEVTKNQNNSVKKYLLEYTDGVLFTII